MPELPAMPELTVNIGAFDSGTGTVPVTFASGEDRYTRPVNACRDESGAYDEAATALRVQDVARGVAVKIEVGAIRSDAEIAADAAQLDAENEAVAA